MTKVNLNNEPNEIITGNDNIVIAKYLDGIDGGRSLDVTGYPLKVIKAGVPAITDGAVYSHQYLQHNNPVVLWLFLGESLGLLIASSGVGGTLSSRRA